MTRREAFEQFLAVLDDVVAPGVEYDRLRRAAVEYGSAAANEVLGECREAVRNALDPAT